MIKNEQVVKELNKIVCKSCSEKVSATLQSGEDIKISHCKCAAMPKIINTTIDKVVGDNIDDELNDIFKDF